MKKRMAAGILLTAMVCSALFAGCGGKAAEKGSGARELLNVSYDPTREFYAEYNELFSEYWKEKTGEEVSVAQSH